MDVPCALSDCTNTDDTLLGYRYHDTCTDIIHEDVAQRYMTTPNRRSRELQRCCTLSPPSLSPRKNLSPKRRIEGEVRYKWHTIDSAAAVFSDGRVSAYKRKTTIVLRGRIRYGRVVVKSPFDPKLCA